MGTCPKCGKDNPDDAAFCGHCGEKQKIEETKSQFEKNVENFGEELEKIGKKIEKTIETGSTHVETWYDNTFGIFGPIFSALIGFVFLFIVVKAFAFFGSSYLWMDEVSKFLDPLLLYMLPIIFISSFSNYYTKKYTPFRYISPIIGTMVFIFWFWIAINILSILGSSWNRPFFSQLSNFLDILLIPIACLILLLGYVGVLTSSKPKTTHTVHTSDEGESHEEKPSETKKDTDYKRLYRSGKNRMVAGVLGGFAEYLGIDPTLLRVVSVILLIASLGFMILAYLVSWIMIPRNPMHKW